MIARVRINPDYITQQTGRQSNFKEFYDSNNGVTYSLSGHQIKPIPEEVATAWAAADSDVEIVERT